MKFTKIDNMEKQSVPITHSGPDYSFWESNSVSLITGMLCSLIVSMSGASFAMALMMGVVGCITAKFGRKWLGY